MAKKINYLVASLIDVYVDKKYIEKEDRVYYINRILNELNVDYDKNIVFDNNHDIPYLYNEIGNIAVKTYKKNKLLFINKISDLVGLSPLQTRDCFNKLVKTNSQKAFDDFYKVSQDFYYIKRDAIAKNLNWKYVSKYGGIDITINLSKPEKSIEQIKLDSKNKNRYPSCPLCFENMGYGHAHSVDYKQNLRYIFDKLNNKKMYMHYSPYEYFHHHLIINYWEHKPIEISLNTYKQMLEFIRKYPFYFIGSNADLPIVGGSILSHSHYQGGGKDLPIFKAKSSKKYLLKNAIVEILNWPMSVIKISSNDDKSILQIANKFTNQWFKYKSATIKNSYPKNRNNTITPIANYDNKKYTLYLILRNNSTSTRFPQGIFHIHENLWNIKKENIGLIEASGKAILPGRLLSEVDVIKESLFAKKIKVPKSISHHQKWYKDLVNKIDLSKDIDQQIRKQISKLFVEAIENCNVFKNNQDFIVFVEKVIHAI